MDSEQGKIFVGGISWETNEDTLKDHFNKFGEVVETVIMRDRNTGSARGFGFVLFSDPSVADKVLLEKHVVLGRTVEVKKAVPRGEHNNPYNQKGFNKSNGNHNGQFRTKKIFVGGLSPNLTEEEFKAYFEKFGRTTDVVVMYDTSTHRPRGFGFITFDTEEAVENVMQKSFHELNDKVVEVKRAVPKDGSNHGHNGGGYNMRMNGGGRGGSVFGGGIYPPLRPGYGGIYSGYPPQLSGYASAGGYPYGALGGYHMGGYGAVGYGGTPIVSPRSPLWNSSAMVGSRRSPMPFGAPAMYPGGGYLNGGFVGMPGAGYRGIMGPAANGKWNLGGDAQMPAAATSPGVDGGKMDDDSSDLAGSYGVGAGKTNQRGIEGRFRPYSVANSS